MYMYPIGSMTKAGALAASLRVFDAPEKKRQDGNDVLLGWLTLKRWGASLLVGCYLKELLEDVMIWPAEDSSEELLVRCEEEQSGFFVTGSRCTSVWKVTISYYFCGGAFARVKAGYLFHEEGPLLELPYALVSCCRLFVWTFLTMAGAVATLAALQGWDGGVAFSGCCCVQPSGFEHSWQCGIWRVYFPHHSQCFKPSLMESGGSAFCRNHWGFTMSSVCWRQSTRCGKSAVTVLIALS